MRKRFPEALPAVIGLHTDKCPTFGHNSHVVCGKCREEEVASFRSRIRLLSAALLSTTLLFVFGVVVFVVILIREMF